ncbi:hypothetical protein [Citricoccus sp. GCM10030269]|uniref:hypothetical protein n=1 Tax=Citricoccus sp. GCM10030269 TaxID=3273388 RepID=UPI00361D5E9E
MSINEEHRQTDIAAEMEAAARTLAHSTRTIAVPSDSYALLGELHATTDHLSQICRQVAAWHDAAGDGTHYQGQDPSADGETGAGTAAAASGLRQAASALSEATQALMAANGAVRWYPQPTPKEGDNDAAL